MSKNHYRTLQMAWYFDICIIEEKNPPHKSAAKKKRNSILILYFKADKNHMKIGDAVQILLNRIPLVIVNASFCAREIKNTARKKQKLSVLSIVG